MPGVMTYSRSRHTTETTLTTLSGETYNTTLSSNTLRSRDTSSTLNKTPQQPVSNEQCITVGITQSLVEHSRRHHRNQGIPSLH